MSTPERPEILDQFEGRIVEIWSAEADVVADIWKVTRGADDRERLRRWAVALDPATSRAIDCWMAELVRAFLGGADEGADRA
jgi:hypothetical protein